MSKYNKEFKGFIIEQYLCGKSPSYLSKKHGVKRETIRTWIRLYKGHGTQVFTKNISKTKYSADFKLHVLDYRQENGLTYEETAEIFDIKHGSTIANWQRAYDAEGIEGLSRPIGRQRKVKPEGVEIVEKEKKNEIENEPVKLDESERDELKRLREENELLLAENLYLKKLRALTQSKKQQTKKK
ncbi:MAG: helix-turn-helix domain-containing protein [Acholeplasmataceae bacterium]|jgi:transposase